MSILSFAVILKNSDIAVEYVRKGMTICAKSIIPSLFPFMVISELIVNGCGELLGRIFKKPMKLLFGISGSSGCAVILGFLCGYPIGARVAASLYESDVIEREEFERLLTFTNNASSAFVINAIGISLYSNRKIGVLIWVCSVIAAVIIGIFQNIISRKSNQQNEKQIYIIKKPLNINIFTDAISQSAFSMLIVCAYIIFFSSVIGCLSQTLDYFYIPDEVRAFILGFLEISSGTCEAALLKNKFASILLSAFIVGWSGLSVHFQIMSICDSKRQNPKKSISFVPYFIAKFFHGILTSLMTFCGILIFPDALNSIESVNAYIGVPGIALAVVFCNLLFIICTVVALYRFLSHHITSKSDIY